MTENQAQDRGDVLLEWTAPEFTQYARGRGWYVAFFIVVFGLLVIGLLSRNYTFALLVFTASLVLVLRFRRAPAVVRMAIRDEGIEVGAEFFPWRDLAEFWILYRPPAAKKIYFHFKGRFRPPIDLSLEQQNPLKVRETLAPFLPENTAKSEEPAVDQLTRFFKI